MKGMFGVIRKILQ